MLEIINLTKSYEDITLYKDFNLKLPKNKIICIMGESGCGKTTLLRMIAGLEKYQKGKIQWQDNSKVSFVFQEDRLIPWKNVYQNLEFVLKSCVREEEIPTRIKNVLEKLELIEYKDYPINRLSGGMKRRVSIARAILYPSETLIMDEPFKGLDEKLKNKIINQLIELTNSEQKTIILVTHDLSETKKLANWIIKLEGKPIKAKIMENNTRHSK